MNGGKIKMEGLSVSLSRTRLSISQKLVCCVQMEIVYIPDKPPVPSNQQPTVDVFAAQLEPKLANTLVRRLNQIAPLESLRHVKRVRKKLVQGGKPELSVILCIASDISNQLYNFPRDVQDLIISYNLTPFKTNVCKYAATSKEEWEEQCKLWPTSYHPPTYNIDGIMGFSEEDSQSIFSFMHVAIQLAKSSSGSVVNAAVIVDPSVKRVISSACDQTCSWDALAEEILLENSCLKQAKAFNSKNDCEGTVSHKTLHSNVFADEKKQLYTNVSCLFPWGWAQQQADVGSCRWHPLRHAAIVAIESSAARDRHLFPNLSEIQDNPVDMGSLAKRQKTNFEKVKGDDILDSGGEDSHSQSARPYLCTGYDIYLVWEPCTMCAMALVHQRIRRIFFASPNPNAGALGSVYRLQGERSLNHHYAVFRVLVPDQVLHAAETH